MWTGCLDVSLTFVFCIASRYCQRKVVIHLECWRAQIHHGNVSCLMHWEGEGVPSSCPSLAPANHEQSSVHRARGNAFGGSRIDVERHYPLVVQSEAILLQGASFEANWRTHMHDELFGTTFMYAFGAHCRTLCIALGLKQRYERPCTGQRVRWKSASLQPHQRLFHPNPRIQPLRNHASNGKARRPERHTTRSDNCSQWVQSCTTLEISTLPSKSTKTGP